MFVDYATPPRYILVGYVTPPRCILAGYATPPIRILVGYVTPPRCMLVGYATPPGCILVCYATPPRCMLVGYATPPRCMLVGYATPPRCFASRAHHFQGFIYDPRSGRLIFYFIEIHPAINMLTKNGITPFCFYLHLFATLSEKFCTIVDNVMRLFPIVQSYVIQGKTSLHVIITASITS